MTVKPDWLVLDGIAAAFLASTPLATAIAAVTPAGSYTATGLQLDLDAVLKDAGTKLGLDGTLTIAVDTLTMTAGDHKIPSLGLEIVARSIQVAGSGSATLLMPAADAAAQFLVVEIDGAVAVQAGAKVQLPPAAVPIPRVLTAAGGDVSAATDARDLADVLHQPWNILALQVSSAIAGVVADGTAGGTPELATAMLRWVIACGTALIAERASYPNVDYVDVASMMTAASALLASTQAAVSGAIYVPVLSAEVYSEQVRGILSVAQIYDGKIAALQDQTGVTKELSAFAATLASISNQATVPLIATLQNLANETTMLEQQLTNASTQLQQILATLESLQDNLVEAIEDKFQKELVSTAVKLMLTVATLYASIGFAAADPALVSVASRAAIKAASGVIKAVLDATTQTLATVIAAGASAAAQPAKPSAIVQEGAQALAGSACTFGTSMNTLWAVVGTAIAEAPKRIEYAPDFLAALEKAPDLSGLSTGGVDPVTYWKTVVIQTKTCIEPNKELAAAAAYLQAIELASAYGAAVGDLQMKLLDLYTQGVSTFAQLQSIYQAQDRWTALQSALANEDAQVAAAVGLLRRGYLDVKRSLVTAVGRYRAAFRYQWLQETPVAVDVTMSYLELAAQVEQSIDGLIAVLAGKIDGTVRPRQIFTDITYKVAPRDAPLFVEVNGRGEARWAIPAGDPALSIQLNGITALYLSKVTFQLDNPLQTDEVELVAATSGRYETLLNGTSYRFVSQAVSMNNFYMPGSPPTFISSWQFADPAAYMMPTPYTDWTLSVGRGEWTPTTTITMTLSGSFLQNRADIA